MLPFKVVGANKIPALASALQENVALVESNYCEQISVLREKEDTGLSLVGFSDTVDLKAVSYQELRDLTVFLLQVRTDLAEIARYAQLNFEAFRRIESKRLRASPSSNGPCLKASVLGSHQAVLVSVKRIDSILEIAREALRKPLYQGNRTESLLKRSLPSAYAHNTFSQIYPIISRDDVTGLTRILGPDFISSDDRYQLISTMLELAFIYHAHHSFQLILSKMLQSSSVSHMPHMIHRIAWRFSLQTSLHANDFNNNAVVSKSHESIQDYYNCCDSMVTQMLDRYVPQDAAVLDQRDLFGSSTSHYLACTGSILALRKYLDSEIPCTQYSHFESLLRVEPHQSSPLQVMMTNESLDQLEITLQYLVSYFKDSRAPLRQGFCQMICDLQALTIRLKSHALFSTLLKGTHYPDCTTSTGETILYLAAREGQARFLESILEEEEGNENALNRPENNRGWTPLCAACSEGHIENVELLLEAGCDSNKVDMFGWTAKEHAAYRGHLKIAELLHAHQMTPERSLLHMGPLRKAIPVPCPSVPNVADRSVVLIQLGSSNSRRKCDKLKLERPVLHDMYCHNEDPVLQITTSAVGSAEPAATLDLLSISEIANQPLILEMDAFDTVAIRFKLHWRVNEEEPLSDVIGTGIAVLNQSKTGLADRHESLVRDHEVPIINTKSSELVGMLTFNALVVRPYEKPPPPVGGTQGFWKAGSGTPVIGHRGRKIFHRLTFEHWLMNLRLWC